MKIAQVAPLFESVPPRAYGGTERVAAFLADEFVDMGHDVTLFATGDSETKAKLFAVRDTGIRLDTGLISDVADHMSMLARLRDMEDQFDIIHFHTDMLQMPYFDDCADKTVTTQHGRLDLKGLKQFYQLHRKFPLVSISYNQRRPLLDANWARNVYHGLPADLHSFTPGQGQNDLIFLGRFSEEKGAHTAIDIARRTGHAIRLAAKICHAIPANEIYYEKIIAPRLRLPGVEYCGEIGERQKTGFIGDAKALMMMSDWPEPFGLVMIEAMACGTPVIALRRGSVPEIIEDGVTGFVVETAAEAEIAVGRLGELDRGRIRKRFEERFTSRIMATNYLDLYTDLLNHDVRPAGAGYVPTFGSASSGIAGSFKN